MFQKILVASPTASAKNYAFPAWLENTLSFKYPNFQVRLFDNTLDNGENVDFLNRYFKDNYGQNNDQFKAIKSNTNAKSVIDRMVVSHNDCREYALKNGYPYMLHLESDVMAPPTIIEDLLCYDKQVIGALYDRDEGRGRMLMIQKKVETSPRTARTENLLVADEIRFVDGKVKEVAHVGFGCLMIRRDVLEKFPFCRDKDDLQAHPDTVMARLYTLSGIKIFAATNLYADHFNKSWGLYGEKFDFH